MANDDHDNAITDREMLERLHTDSAHADVATIREALGPHVRPDYHTADNCKICAALDALDRLHGAVGKAAALCECVVDHSPDCPGAKEAK